MTVLFVAAGHVLTVARPARMTWIATAWNGNATVLHFLCVRAVWTECPCTAREA